MVFDVLFGLFGLSVLLGIAWLFSNNKRSVNWKLVATGVSMQVGFATFVLLGDRMVQWVQSWLPIDVSDWKLTVLVGAGIGIALLLLPWVFSLFDSARVPTARDAAVRKIGFWVLGLSVLLALPFASLAFDSMGRGFVQVLGFVSAGSNFIFGSLMDVPKNGFIFAFQVLPTIIFFASLMGVLYHLGVMQLVVRGMAWVITKVMRVSGAETTSVCASVFIGQTEAPLTVRPYISKMTESELLTMMIGGMAHIAGGVLAAYVGMLGAGDPVKGAFYAKHLLAASIMAAPATIVLAKLLVPETGEPLTRGTVKLEVEKTASNVIDAAAAGAGDGLRLALNIAAMLLAFIALIALLNWPLAGLGSFQWSTLQPAMKALLSVAALVAAAYGVLRAIGKIGSDSATSATARSPVLGMSLATLCAAGAVLVLACIYSQPGFTINGNLSAMLGHPVELSLQTILGYVLAPIAWVIGVPWSDATVVGSLIGQKIVLNEFVAYLQLADIVNGKVAGVALSAKGTLIATYALCGFANFSSIAIQIGGIGGLAPERRGDLARFGLRAVLGGSLATLMTATIAGVLTSLGAA